MRAKQKRERAGANGTAPPVWHRRAIMGLVALLVVLLGWRLLNRAPRELPPEAAEQALYNTFGAPSYRFSTVSTIYLDNEQRLFCQLNGEKSGYDRHIQGELLGNPLNIYLVEGELYQQSALDKSWRQVAQADLAEAQKLMGEIVPESNFAFDDIGVANYVGVEEIDGRKLHRIELRPVMADVWIGRFFTNIVSTLWLDEEGQYIVKARMEAVSSENPGVKLTVNNSFSDFGAEIEVAAPL